MPPGRSVGPTDDVASPATGMLHDLVELLADRSSRVARPYIVGLTGSVAAGKTALADEFAAAFAERDTPLVATVVSTDGFLYPNSVLEPQGLIYHKGLPGTYDTRALVDFLRAVRAGEPMAVPVHSHDTYDIVAAGRVVEPGDVIIVEGLHLLGPHAALGEVAVNSLLDDCIYLDADREDLEAWFVERFMRMRGAAFGDPTSFYATFAALDTEAATAAARFVWSDINAVNLTEHIEPGRAQATIVVAKASDHSITAITVR